MKKYAIVFASTQLRIARLRKYPIDPKAYLGRCSYLGILGETPIELNRERLRSEKVLNSTPSARILEHPSGDFFCVV